jgi:dUTP pyrophosphatase
MSVSQLLNNFFSLQQTPVLTVPTSFAVLKIYTENEELKNIYKNAIEKHNSNMSSSKFPDSGFDLYCPEQVNIVEPNKAHFVDYQIKTEMLYYNKSLNSVSNSPFYMYPRSSFSKTPLILGNHVGIIDSGYRGNLIGAFKFLPNDKYATNYTIEKEQRLLQICHPSLCPIYVVLVENDDLQITERGTGGFGSTGI